MGQIGYGEGSWGRASAFSIATMGCAAIAMLVLSCGDGAVEPTPPDPPRPTSVTVAPATAELDALGATTRLSAQVRDQNGQVMAGASVAWSSSNASVATVDGAGLVTAAANGAATITATAGSASGAAVVTVMQSVASITVSPAARSIVRGDTVRLLAEAFDENNHRVQDAEFVWASSDVAVVRVDESGIVTGVGDGSATVTARVGEVSGTAAITVANPDRAVLVALYEATDGPNWMDATNWLTDAPLGEWYGVETDDQGRVTRVELRGNALNGVIPPEVGSLANLTRLNMWDNQLTGEIPPTLGSLANLVDLKLLGNDLTGEIPPELGKLVNLKGLFLNGNELTGKIPPELGDLVHLIYLNLSSLDLTGPIPTSFLRLNRLRGFYAQWTDNICVPGTSAFAAWLQQLRTLESLPPHCNAEDVAALHAFYDAAGGTGWINAGAWLTGHAVEEWYGVESDSLGRVTALDLSANGLVGELPPTLVPAALNRMSVLRIGDNALVGRLPPWLTGTPLRELRYAETTLCAPIDTSFKAWLNSIQTHVGTGLECTPLSERDILGILYKATNGPDWSSRAGWMTDAPLAEWHGVNTGAAGRVTHVDLDRNGLTGPIPPELGKLTGLVNLSLAVNDLVGPIPSEIGNLGNLVELNLFENDLNGPIPPELGKLANLERLVLQINALTGEIPPELGTRLPV